MDYSKLTELYEKIFSSTKRLDKTYYISEFLKNNKEIPNYIFLLLKGKVFPDWDDTKINFAAKMAIKAMSLASGFEIKKIEKLWKEKGDLGEVAEVVIGNKKQSTLFSETLSIEKVYNNIKKLSTKEGAGSADTKIKLVSELLTSATGIEAKYIIRTVLEDMRVGIGDGTIRDSIAYSLMDNLNYNKENDNINYEIEPNKKYNPDDIKSAKLEFSEKIQEAYDLANEWAKVFKVLKEGGFEKLKEISIEFGKPIKVMLFPKALDYKDAFERVGAPCAFEYKYDGFRMQIHKNDDNVKIFTRRLENVTNQFPDVVDIVKNNINANNCILDSEAVAIDKVTGKYKPFQSVSQRIKRKHGIDEMVKQLPIELNIFDIIYYNDDNLLKTPFSERRKIIDKITKQEKGKIVIAEQIITDNEEEATQFFKEAIEVGNEGLMAKKLDGIYKPGARIGYGVKIKALKETLDLVIVKAEWGEGKRAGWLSSFTVACMDEDGSLLEIGKVSTGFKEKDDSIAIEGRRAFTFEKITNLLKPLIIADHGKEVHVKPEIIIEVGHEEIQKSPSYSSGYALRFPRFMGLREDKALDEISSIDYVDALFNQQNK